MKQAALKATFIIMTMFTALFCSAQWTHVEENGITITYSHTLSPENDTSIVISLTIDDGNKKIDFGGIELNASNILNKDALSGILVDKYADLRGIYSTTVLSDHSQYLTNMIDNIKDTINENKTHSFVYQGLFIWQSLLKATSRELNNSGMASFHVADSYILALSSFVCEEDIIINIRNFQDYLTERKVQEPENVGIDYYLGALENETSLSLNLVELTVKLEDFFGGRSSWPQGGACGCCGNYTGNCIFWSKVCLVHDIACHSCDYNWCGRACQPSGCSGGMVPWWWM